MKHNEIFKNGHEERVRGEKERDYNKRGRKRKEEEAAHTTQLTHKFTNTSPTKRITTKTFRMDIRKG